KKIKTDLGGALQLERNALAQSKAGDDGEAKTEIQNSVELLDSGLPAASWMDAPDRFDAVGAPHSVWSHFDIDYAEILTLDKRALKQKGAALQATVHEALARKQDLYNDVTGQLRSYDCRELINLQGPITVNGVPQGQAVLTIDWTCIHAIRSILVD